MHEVPMHHRYTQLINKEHGGFPVRESVGYGRPNVLGKEVRRFVAGSLGFWGLSEARITEGGTIFYRQTSRHEAIKFTPDRSSGLIITHPDRYVTAAAYRVTVSFRTPHVWSQALLRAAVAASIRPAVIDWPDGWALLMPDSTIRFATHGFPWQKEDEYTATPVPQPARWGPACVECGWREAEHDDSAYPFGVRCHQFQRPGA